MTCDWEYCTEEDQCEDCEVANYEFGDVVIRDLASRLNRLVEVGQDLYLRTDVGAVLAEVASEYPSDTPMSNSFDEYAEKYGKVCDLVERIYQGIPLDEDLGYSLTSSQARDAANRIVAIFEGDQ